MEEFISSSQNAYETVCKTLDSKEIKFKSNDEDLSVYFKIQGDDLPMDLVIKAYPSFGSLVLISFLPFKVPEEKRFEIAAAVTVVNNALVDGSFDYDIIEGSVRFRMSNVFADCEISENAVWRMVSVTLAMVEEYNDKFFGIAKGMMDFGKFMEYFKGEMDNG